MFSYGHTQTHISPTTFKHQFYTTTTGFTYCRYGYGPRALIYSKACYFSYPITYYLTLSYPPSGQKYIWYTFAWMPTSTQQEAGLFRMEAP
jgi:hypothetical protein